MGLLVQRMCYRGVGAGPLEKRLCYRGYCGRLWPAKHHALKKLKELTTFEKKETFLPHSKYPHPNIPPCY